MVEHQLEDTFVKIVYAKVKSNGRTEMVPLKLYADGSLEHIRQSLFTSDSSVSPQTVLADRYLVQRILGQGGFGRTYLAADRYRFDELCVLKEFLPHWVGGYEIQKSRELFEQEAKILHQIEHPQIPKFLAYFEEDGRLFLVQEYIKGCTYSSVVRERQQRGETFSEAEIVDWLHQLLPVLDYIHDRKIIHRDISPDNIMLHHDHNTPMLIDFGVGRWTLEQAQGAPSYSRKHSIVGKVGYASHEQIWMGQCFPSSDLYSLAVTAVVLLTGKEPQTLIDLRSLEWQWRDHAKVSNRVAQILNRMLNAKPTERYPSAQDVVAALNSLSSPAVAFVSQPLDPVTIVSQSSARAINARQHSEASPSPIPANLPAPPLLSEIFIQNCEQELMVYIGPIAKFLVQQAINAGNLSGSTTDRASDYATLTPEALVNALAEKIPKQNQAIEFRRRLLHF